jgi:hypothetical protein
MDAFAPSPAEPPHRPSCPGCDRPRTEADVRGVAWSSRHTPDGIEFVCPGCTRAEIGQIEAGLAVERSRTPAA